MRKLGVVFVAALTALVFGASSASAAPSMNISFSADDTSSAQWMPNHSGVLLTVGTDPGAWAVITVHHFPAEAPPTAPTFTTTDYNAGSPRWYIRFDSGAYMFGYPADFGGLWEVHNVQATSMYESYADAMTDISNNVPGDPVVGVFIVADASQAGRSFEIHSVSYWDDDLVS